MKQYDGDPAICSLFKTQASSQITKSNNALLEIEKMGVSVDIVKRIKSEVHTLKGDSRMIGLESISAAAHAVEDLLEALGKGEGDAVSGIIRQLFAVFDAIRDAIERLPGDVVDIDIQSVLAGKKKDDTTPAGRPGSGDAGMVKKRAATGTRSDSGAVKADEAEIINLDVKRIENLISRSTVFPQYYNKFSFLLNQLGEVKGEIEHRYGDDNLIKRLGSIIYSFSHELSFYDLSSRQFQNEITQLKLVPLSTIFDLFPRLVRDVADSTKKKITLSIQGRDVELDKLIVEKLKTILIHMLRNAVDHGCEDPDTRKKAGKAAEGRVVLNAYNMGDNVILEVGDDGSGLDIARIREKAVEKGLLDAAKAVKLPDNDIVPFIFESGLSTKQAGDFSGRGVGMDVVASTVKEMNGEITVSTQKGRGTSFVIKLPLISSFIPVTVFILDDRLFGIPSSYIKNVLRVKPGDIRSISTDSSVLTVGGLDVGLVDLSGFFGFDSNREVNKNVIVIRSNDEISGFIVSDIVYEKKMLIRKNDWVLDRCKILIGAVLSGRERAVPILNVPEIFHLLKDNRIHIARVKDTGYIKKDFRAKNVLLVEDSAVTRTRERDILVGQSLNVVEASNGKEALALLSKDKFDVILTDIEMPVMNGVELVRAVKASEEFRNIPVIVVSSYNTYGEMLAELGVHSFIDKNRFSARLLIEALAMEKIV